MKSCKRLNGLKLRLKNWKELLKENKERPFAGYNHGASLGGVITPESYYRLTRETATLDLFSPRLFKGDFLWRKGVNTAEFSTPVNLAFAFVLWKDIFYTGAFKYFQNASLANFER